MSWIKLHRRFLEWEWFDSAEMVKVFLYLLLSANFEDKKWHGQTIGRGQILTSWDSLSEATGISVQTLRTCLRKLEQTGEISRKSTNKNTIITICNYDRYQVVEEDDQQTTNKQLTSNQQATNKQLTTTKEYKNIRNKEDIDNTSSSKDSEVCPAQPDPEAGLLSRKHCQNVVDYWNRTVKETAAQLPQVKTLSEERVKKIRIRWKEFSSVGDPVEVCRELFAKSCASKFMQGDNRQGWTASFDWLFTNPKNWAKVYEGNYDDREAAPRRDTSFEDELKKLNDYFDNGRFQSHTDVPDEQ